MGETGIWGIHMPQRWAPIMVAGLAYFLLAVSTVLLTQDAHGIATFWPANAVLLAVAGIRPRREWGAIVLAGLAANILATIASRGFIWMVLPFAIANLTEVMVAAHALRRLEGRQVDQSIWVLHFILWAGVIGPLMSALIGVGSAALLMGADFTAAFIDWFIADSLGLLVFGPLFHAIANGDYSKAFQKQTRNHVIEAVALQVLTMLTALITFTQSQLPLLFVVMIPLALVSFRLGWLGTIFAVMIIAVVGAIGTIDGTGPIALMDASPIAKGQFFQFYIATILLTQLPVAGVLMARDRLLGQLDDSAQELETLAARSGTLMLRFDAGGVCRKAVGDASMLLGKSCAELEGRGFATFGVANGALMMTTHLDALDTPDVAHTCEYRIDLDGGRWLEARFVSAYDKGGLFRGSVATITDVTERHEKAAALQRRASTDALTGLANRAEFDRMLARWVDRAQDGGSFHLAMIDVDRFKQVNDTHGHLAGDAALQAVADTIATNLRMDDRAARLGGDEFVLLLATADAGRAAEICNRLVRSVDGHQLGQATGTPFTVAISCGLAAFLPSDNAAQLLARADAALYCAKSGGRNRLAAA